MPAARRSSYAPLRDRLDSTAIHPLLKDEPMAERSIRRVASRPQTDLDHCGSDEAAAGIPPHVLSTAVVSSRPSKSWSLDPAGEASVGASVTIA